MNIMKLHLKMKRTNKTSTAKLLRRLMVCVIMLIALCGSARAQSTPAYVIYSGAYYMAHVKVNGVWELQGVTTFSPDCIWYTSNTHNYYFIGDGVTYYITAPLSGGAAVTLTAEGSIANLANTLATSSSNYYFYNWDWGLARGEQTYPGSLSGMGDCPESDKSEDGTQCWTVYWVEYYGGAWKTSSTKHYNPSNLAAVFRRVRINEHPVTVSSETGGLGNLTVTSPMANGDNQSLSISISDYSFTSIPAYTTYSIGELENCGSDWASRTCDTNWQVHNYYGGADHGSTIPDAQASSTHPSSSATYSWTATGSGASFLTFSNNTAANPTLTYNGNKSGDKTATITVTVTYGVDGPTQTRSAEVELTTGCGNPLQAAAPVVNYEDVIVSWVRTSTDYNVSYRKVTTPETAWTTVNNVGDVTSYSISGLEYEANYQYKVEAICVEPDATAPMVYTFTTKSEPGLLIYGAVFGGGRMADVAGKTEVIIINCDSISAVYGGNDIAGSVVGNDGSTIILGVAENDANATAYNSGAASTKVVIGDVYGGGNGFYAYNGSSFVAASNSYSSESVANNGTVNALTPTSALAASVWTNTTGESYTLNFPSIKKTNITVTNDAVKVDSLFGGAKNAFISNPSAQSTHITLNGGTIYSVFGGNNWGGTLASGSSQQIDVNMTKIDLTAIGLVNGGNTGFGRDFGVRYLFGGGNMVPGRDVVINVTGGMVDTLFGGGNRADVGSVNIAVNIPLSDSDDGTKTMWDKTISKAFQSYPTIDNTYKWDGYQIYNVRALFGGNNAAGMADVPTVTLTSGSIGTVYGGGNAGPMLAQETTTINGTSVKYGTHVIMNSTNIYVDYLYGGCQKSDVDYSTWVEVQNGYVGTVYGGCNISGDVGSTRTNPSAASSTNEYQMVQGGTNVVVTGGNVYKNLFAGSNGFYHCNDGKAYVRGVNYDDPEENYIGLLSPTHNETTVLISGNPTIYGNVYAGGNLACVGFSSDHWAGNAENYPVTVGIAKVTMTGGTVAGNVYGGGNMASIYGINEVLVSGGTIGGALYGGNDRTGRVAEISNRVLPPEYGVASDGKTSLTDRHVDTYVSVSGNPRINTVYGGGNGDYDYTSNSDIPYCGNPIRPIQRNTFVDIHTDGNAEIGTVYGGGDGVTVEGGITVFVNVQNPDATDDIDVIFGGNNKGDLDLLPEIIMLHGLVNTVYGGCNQGAMVGSHTYTANGTEYTNVGSMVHLLGSYTADGTTITPDAVVTGSVYGGCRMNNVDNNSLVIVDGGTHSNASIYGGCDISGTILGTSQVVTNGGTVAVVYGGGNGNYTYNASELTVYDGEELVATGDYDAPHCTNVQVDILGGTIGAAGTAETANVVFGGGLGQETSTTGTTTVNIGLLTDELVPTVYGSVYGGSALGEVQATTVNVIDGHVYASVYGGGLGDSVYLNTLLSETGHTNIAAKVSGNSVVNIGQVNEGTYSGNATIDGYVFGGNNNNGSPAGTATVNIYKTAHTTGDDGNTVPITPELNIVQMANKWWKSNPTPTDSGSLNSYYALKGVYGGGNLAHKASSGLSTVHVWGCENSIKYVYGGGKAADLAGSAAVIVDGGHIYQVFGGGDGSVEGTYANILGGTNTTINGGYMHYVFGGSNTRGTITGTKEVNIADAGSCVDPIIYNFFAGGNLAASSGNIETNVTNCNVKFGNFYGGANQASITGNVTTTIKGGTYRQIFGGSKSADITGNVTVNFNGGTVGNLFGGNNTSGEISGTIVVNVEKNSECGFSIDYVYGGGRDAAYGDGGHNHGNYPQVNIIHTGANTATEKVVYDVFGGGLGTGAQVYGNPQVNIGDGVGGHTVTVGRNVFGGGSAAQVNGNTAVKVLGTTTSVGSNVYGGGNEATVTGNTDVQIGD